MFAPVRFGILRFGGGKKLDVFRELSYNYYVPCGKTGIDRYLRHEDWMNDVTFGKDQKHYETKAEI